MASVAVIAGVLGGMIGLCLVITGILLVYCFYLKRKLTKNIGGVTQNPESEYFEAIDFSKLRKNKSQDQKQIHQPDSSLVKKGEIASTDLIMDSVEYYNTMQMDTNIFKGLESQIGTNTYSESNLKTGESISSKNDSRTSNIDFGDEQSRDFEKNNKVIQLMGSTGSEMGTGSSEIPKREDSVTNIEASEYFVLEKENTTECYPKEKSEVEEKCSVNCVQTNTTHGKQLEPNSNTEEIYYINQSSYQNYDRRKEETGSDNLYFVLEKC